MNNGAITSVIVLSSLISTCRLGPAVSLNGSPTVSPTTAALCASDPLPPYCPVSMYFVGGLLGAMLVFLFSALAIRAVSQAAQYVIMEVRRQFKEKPGILAGTERPDYGRCVDIVTRGALRQMVLPGILAVAMPIVTGRSEERRVGK